MFENDSTLTLRLQTLTNEANIGNSEKLRTLQKLMKLFLQKGNKKDARLNNSNHEHDIPAFLLRSYQISYMILRTTLVC